MLNNIIEWFLNLLPKPQPILTLRGYYMYKYCKKIMNDELEENNKNAYYEEWLEEMRTKATDLEGNFPDRKLAAQCFVESLEELQPKFCEELEDIGITHF